MWEKSTASVAEAADTADSYLLARPYTECRPQREGQMPVVKGASEFVPGGEKERGEGAKPTSPPCNPNYWTRGQEEDSRKCYSCESLEHMKEQCPKHEDSNTDPSLPRLMQLPSNQRLR